MAKLQATAAFAYKGQEEYTSAYSSKKSSDL